MKSAELNSSADEATIVNELNSLLMSEIETQNSNERKTEMKKLTCEMCGSTELIKQDGVFVCQTCGCKYSIEEARKMMVEGTVEVTGTVKVDNSAAIENYLDMARNALDASNNKEADDYCNRIIEMDVTNWEAWFIKGKSVGWQSTLGNIRIAETINAFSNNSYTNNISFIYFILFNYLFK